MDPFYVKNECFASLAKFSFFRIFNVRRIEKCAFINKINGITPFCETSTHIIMSAGQGQLIT